MIVCLRTIWAGLIGALLAGTATSAAAGWELRVCADPDNMPFSNQAGDGFDNKIAVIIARELGAEDAFVKGEGVQRGALEIPASLLASPGDAGTLPHWSFSHAALLPREFSVLSAGFVVEISERSSLP